MKRISLFNELFLILVFTSTATFGTILTNGDFETGTKEKTETFDCPPWIRDSATNTNAWLDTDPSNGAEKSLKFRWEGVIVYQDFTAFEGVEYLLSVDTYQLEGNYEWRPMIAVEWYDAGSTLIGSRITVAEIAPEAKYPDDSVEANTWYEISGLQTAPAGTATGRVILKLFRTESGIARKNCYFDNAAVRPIIPDDQTPPDPNEMGFATAPYAQGTNSITMVALTATDPSGVEYSFECTSGGGKDSGWQADTTYTDLGLNPDTTYGYRVKARDLSSNLNETSYSPVYYAATDPRDPNSIVVNGNFEDGTAGQFGSVTVPGWSTWGTGGWVTDDLNEALGNYSVKLTNNSSGAYQQYSVSGDESYDITALITSYGSSPMMNRMALITAEWYNGADMSTILKTDSIGSFIQNTDPFNTWHSIHKIITSPADATILRVLFFLADVGGSPHTGAAVFDEFDVILLSGPDDSDAPTPDPMTFAALPHAEGSHSISMLATTASDATSVEYYFTCISGGGHDSGWQADPYFLDSGLTADATYSYTVKARDLSANYNETTESAEVFVTTNTPFTVPMSNGDFEQSTVGNFGSVTIPGWTTWGTGGSVHSEAGNTLDTLAVKIWDPNTGLYQDISPVKDNHYYRVTASMASFSPDILEGRDGVVTAEWYNHTDMNTVLQSNLVGYLVSGLDDNDSWKTVSALIQAPTGATVLRITADVLEIGEITPSGSAYFDDISVSAEGPVLCKDGDLDMNCLVNMADLGILSEGWSDIYTLTNLSALAEDWLDCAMFEHSGCSP